MRKEIIFSILSILCIFSISGCSKKEEVKDVDIGVYESYSVEETNEFAVDVGIEVNNMVEEVKPTYPDNKNEIIYDTDEFTEDEIEELKEIDNDVMIDPFSGEVYNLSDYESVDYMRLDASNDWKESYLNGYVTKEDIQNYFYSVYEKIDKKEIDKVIDEIISDDKEVNLDGIEYEETFSEDELTKIKEDLESKGIYIETDVTIVNDSTGYQVGSSDGLPPLRAN